MSSNNGQPQVPGEPTKTTTSVLKSHLSLNVLLVGFTFTHDMTRQVEAHHYCGHQNEEMRQCLIYDSPDKNAKLIGLEYITSENLFLTLLDEEKRLSHSHLFEVKSGFLCMPNVPNPIEHKDMEKVYKTYGKVYHF